MTALGAVGTESRRTLDQENEISKRAPPATSQVQNHLTRHMMKKMFGSQSQSILLDVVIHIIGHTDRSNAT